jgi:hypothetical protein
MTDITDPARLRPNAGQALPFGGPARGQRRAQGSRWRAQREAQDEVEARSKLAIVVWFSQ